MMISIAILASLRDGTGNQTTAKRICSYLKPAFNAHICCITQFHSSNDFKKFVIANHIQAIIGLHLVRAGKLLVDCEVPYAMIFGGTDINLKNHAGRNIELMLKVVTSSKYLIAFTNEIKMKAMELWPTLEERKIIVQNQGVIINPETYSFEELFEDNQIDASNIKINEAKVLLLVGGIRPIKDPLYLADIISEWHRIDPRIYLIIIGPELDEAYSLFCKQKVARLPGIFMCSLIPCQKVYSLMQASSVYVNSSLSEGMAGAILEAMHIGIPVLARENVGNSSIITDMSNGMLYTTPQEFKSKAQLLFNDSKIYNEIVQNAASYVHSKHDYKNEKMTYMKIMGDLLS